MLLTVLLNKQWKKQQQRNPIFDVCKLFDVPIFLAVVAQKLKTPDVVGSA